ncbi:hypothetical protein Plhal304r1_c008g0034171 [Plasmopara halstedii]
MRPDAFASDPALDFPNLRQFPKTIVSRPYLARFYRSKLYCFCEMKARQAFSSSSIVPHPFVRSAELHHVFCLERTAEKAHTSFH